MRFRFLLFTLVALAFSPPVFGQSLAKTFTLSAANQNACIGTNGLPTVGIDLTGTSSLTMQPQVSINGSTPKNSSVTSTVAGSSPQATIVTSGSTTASYVAPVGGFDTFCLNVSSYSSGTATVVLNPSPALNASLLKGSTPAPTFDEIGSGTNTTAAMVVGTGASLATSGSGTIAATSAPFSGISAGTNGNALVEGAGGSLLPSGTGYVVGNDVWVSYGPSALVPPTPTLTAAGTGGSLSTATNVFVYLTFVGAPTVTPANEVEIQLNAATGCSTGSSCSVTVTLPSACTSPTAPVTGCTVWTSNAISTEKQQTASAACVNITSSTCVVGTLGTGATLASSYSITTGTNPPNYQAVPYADLITPSVFIQKSNGFYGVAGVDHSAIPLISCCVTNPVVTPPANGSTNGGTFTWMDRLNINDDVTFPAINNAMISIQHQSGNTTSTLTSSGAGSLVNDYVMGMRMNNNLTTNPNYEQLIDLYAENIVSNPATTCSPVGAVAPFAESCSAVLRGVITDKRVSPTANMSFEGGAFVASSSEATVSECSTPCYIGVKGGAFESVNNTAGGSAEWVGGYFGFNAASGNTAGTGFAVEVQKPTTRFATQNIGVHVQDFGSNTSDWAFFAASSAIPGDNASMFQGNVWLPAIFAVQGTIPINNSINVTGGVTTTQLTAPTISNAAPTNPGAQACQYKATSVDANGAESTSSAVISIGTCNANITSTNSVAITIASQHGPNSYNIYRTVEAGNCNGVPCTNGKLGNIVVANSSSTQNNATIFTDTGQVGDGNTAVAQANTTGAVSAFKFSANTNCAVNSVSPAACGAASMGAVVIPTATATYTINTTAVTAASRIQLTWLSFASNLPSSPTCVPPNVTAEPTVSAISPGTSFTITLASTTGQTCPQFSIFN